MLRASHCSVTQPVLSLQLTTLFQAMRQNQLFAAGHSALQSNEDCCRKKKKGFLPLFLRELHLPNLLQMSAIAALLWLLSIIIKCSLTSNIFCSVSEAAQHYLWQQLSPLRTGTLGNVVPSGKPVLKQPQRAGGALWELQKGQQK